MHLYLGPRSDRICWPSPRDLTAFAPLGQGSGEDCTLALFPQQQPIRCSVWGGGWAGAGDICSHLLPFPHSFLSTQRRSINKSCSCMQTLPVFQGPSCSRLHASTQLASNNMLTFYVSSYPLLWRPCVFLLPPHAWHG